jgi:hypothetical protein
MSGFDPRVRINHRARDQRLTCDRASTLRPEVGMSVPRRSGRAYAVAAAALALVGVLVFGLVGSSTEGAERPNGANERPDGEGKKGKGKKKRKGPFRIGFADNIYKHQDPAVRAEWLSNTRDIRASIVRIDVPWRNVVSNEPANPTDPNDPAYHWFTIDNAVDDAASRGFTVLITTCCAPDFAAPGPARYRRGTYKPDPVAFGDFARALAARYEGQVKHFEAWNEPNLDPFLNPQYEGNTLTGPDVYRKLLNAFYAGVHDVQPGATVVAGSTAPYGDPPGGRSSRPLTFLRDLLCVKKGKKGRVLAANCPQKADFDVLAHHPINTSGGPNRSAIHPDDASTPDVKHVVKILRKAEKKKRTGTRGRHKVWLTEFWWESDPPDKCTGVPVQRHKKWIGKALRSFRRQGAKVAINFQIRDTVYRDRQCGLNTLQTAPFFVNGETKPAFKAFRKFARRHAPRGSR